MNRRERRAAAAKSKRDTSASPAADMAVVFNAVVADLRAQKYLDAQIRCQRALEQNPENPELLHLMALVCFNAAQFEHAAEWALRAQVGDDGIEDDGHVGGLALVSRLLFAAAARRSRRFIKRSQESLSMAIRK